MATAIQKSRAWLTIVYPDSAPLGWWESLSERGLAAVRSPLHDRDTNAGTGERKKPHYHVMLLWDGPTTRNNAEEYRELIGGVGLLRAASVRGSARYFVHADNPEKAQYSPADVACIGGIDFETLTSSDSDDFLMLADIFAFIDAHAIVSYRAFIRWAMANRPDWAKLILTKHRSNVMEYQRSLKWEIDMAALGVDTEHYTGVPG